MDTDTKLQVPAGEVLLRKVKGSEGFHERVGYAKLNRIYTVGDRWAKWMVEGGEFQYLYPEDAAAAATIAGRSAADAILPQPAPSENGKAKPQKPPGK